MRSTNNPRVLILLKHYEPGFRFGGPITSVANLVAVLRDEFAFRIVCLNRDFLQKAPLKGIQEGVWLERNGAQVCYVDATLSRPFSLIRAIRSVEYDILYLNSFFDPLFSALPAVLMKLHALRRRPMIVAPRGELSPGALSLKSLKKSLFIRVQSLLGVYSGAAWQASTELEAEDIRKALGTQARVLVASDLSSSEFRTRQRSSPKMPGVLRIVYLSRISPKKNLLSLLRAAGQLHGAISLDIWGPIADPEYWDRCKSEIALLPGNVNATYCGEIERDRVGAVLARGDVFALPTLNENFGHVIHEALSSGCPVVISDKTPWQDVSTAGVGFVVSLGKASDFVGALQTFVDMDASTYDTYPARCRAYAITTASPTVHIQASRRMLAAHIVR